MLYEVITSQRTFTDVVFSPAQADPVVGRQQIGPFAHPVSVEAEAPRRAAQQGEQPALAVSLQVEHDIVTLASELPDHPPALTRRTKFPLLAPAACSDPMDLMQQRMSVITSYSIHYTKLYESDPMLLLIRLPTYQTF